MAKKPRPRKKKKNENDSEYIEYLERVRRVLEELELLPSKIHGTTLISEIQDLIMLKNTLEAIASKEDELTIEDLVQGVNALTKFCLRLGQDFARFSSLLVDLELRFILLVNKLRVLLPELEREITDKSG